jgi:hypothetical protein
MGCRIAVSSSARSGETFGTSLPSSARVRAAERAAWTRTSAKEWANESSKITTAEAVRYCVRTDTSCWCEADNEVLDPSEAQKVVIVDERDMDAHLPTITQRLTQAGIRLGHLLNRAFGGE